MEEMRRNTLVGLFVAVGLVVLGVLVVVFSQTPAAIVGAKGYALHVHFPSAAGIRPENMVTAGGIPIGRVASLEFINPAQFDRGVKVTVIIDDEYKIPIGSRAMTTEPVLGQGRPPVEIVPGPPGLGILEPGAVIPGEVRGAVEQIFPSTMVSTFEKTAARIGEAAEALTPVLDDLHELMTQRDPNAVDRPGGMPGNLSTSVARLDALLKHWNEVLGDPAVKSNLREAITNLHTMTEDGKVAMEGFRSAGATLSEASTKADSLLTKTEETVGQIGQEVTARSRDAQAVMESLDRLVGSLQQITGQVARGEGTVGRLVADPELYESLVLTAQRLSATIEEIRILVKDWQQGKIRVAF